MKSGRRWEGVVEERDHETAKIHDFTGKGLKDSNIKASYVSRETFMKSLCQPELH